MRLEARIRYLTLLNFSCLHVLLISFCSVKQRRSASVWRWIEAFHPGVTECIYWSPLPCDLLVKLQKSFCMPVMDVWFSLLSWAEKRFKAISRIWRFDDKDTKSARRRNDRLAPIHDVFDLWVETLSKSFVPFENVTIDEHLIPFRGPCSFGKWLFRLPDILRAISVRRLLSKKLYFRTGIVYKFH